MSMVLCDECEHLIDSDEDCDCFIQTPGGDVVLCRWCREAAEPPEDDSPEVKLGQAIRSAFAGLDELMCLAAHHDTAALVEKEKIAIGQIVTRAQLVASFLMARSPAGLRMISNG